MGNPSELYPFLFLDIEASSLEESSYPIEIAWVDETGRGESHLVCPEPTWIDWSDTAEALHGIARLRLTSEGKSAAEVAGILTNASISRRVVSDGPEFDRMWLSVLFSGLDRQPPALLPVQIAYAEMIRKHLDPSTSRLELALKAKRIVQACENEEAARACLRHRALHDAEGLWWVWGELSKGCR